ncbi:MAG: hypothetical protein U0L51_08145 [Olegusella sp.]|nr:hypothetical protein [Olegusella sp.]
MRGRDELVERLAERRRAKLGTLSDSAYDELYRAVQANPEEFVDTPEDEAFALLVAALEKYAQPAPDEEFLDEPAYLAARTKRYTRLTAECDRALALDPGCTDAALLKILMADLGCDELLDRLCDLDQAETDAHGALTAGEVGDAWADVEAHGRLRVRAAISRAYLDSARYRAAQSACEDLLALAPSDVLGTRHTCALALARLEDEEGFDTLDAHAGRTGDSWTHLGRVILLYKLGRMSAAKRALTGFSHLVEGGAYALLRPVLVDTYLPDRPEEKPCSFGEATLAVYEADPIIVDVPDLPYWAESVPEVARSAQRFADSSGYDW